MHLPYELLVVPTSAVVEPLLPAATQIRFPQLPSVCSSLGKGYVCHQMMERQGERFSWLGLLKKVLIVKVNAAYEYSF